MSELFETDDEEVVDESVDEFIEVPIEVDKNETPQSSLDARRRLERMLEEKRLRDELDDFIDY